MKCFHCNKEIENFRDMTIIAIDRPYINLPFHSDNCFAEVKLYGSDLYIKENTEKVFKFISTKNSKKEKIL